MADVVVAHAGALLRRAGGWTETPRARAVARFGAITGRVGYVAKGALYCVVGGLAIDVHCACCASISTGPRSWC